jgi:hypothetical protein
MKTVFLLLGLCAVGATAQVLRQSTPMSAPVAIIEHISVKGTNDAVVVAIDASQPVTPQAQALSGPDRIVIDLPDAVPGKQLKDIPLHGALRSVRVGLFAAKPPVTRVVLDLKIPQKYQVSTTGTTVTVRVNLAGRLPSNANQQEANQSTPQ